ncbi:hypothetical protein Bpfe_013236, partial [Biomphalaria pfeifferi]
KSLKIWPVCGTLCLPCYTTQSFCMINTDLKSTFQSGVPEGADRRGHLTRDIGCIHKSINPKSSGKASRWV